MKFSFTKNPESEFFIESPNLTKKILAAGMGGGGGVARVSDFFPKESMSEKNVFFLRGVMVRKDWLCM